MAHNQNDVCSCFGNSDVSSCNFSHHRERSHQMHMKDLKPVDQKVVLNCVLPDLSTISDITSGIAFKNMRPFDENTIAVGRNRQKLPIEHFYNAPVVSSESENGEFSDVANHQDSISHRGKGDFHQFSGTVLPFRKSPASNSSESKKRISVCKSKCRSSKIDSKSIYASNTSRCDTDVCDNLIFENQQKCLDVSRRKSGAINSNSLPLKNKCHSNPTQINEQTIKNKEQHKLSQKKSQVPYLKSNCSGDVPTYVKKYQATNHRVKIPDRVKLKVIKEQSSNNYPDELDVDSSSADENASSDIISETSSETGPFDTLSDSVRGYIKKQDEKIMALQNQISTLCDKLEQSNKENCIQTGIQSVNLKQRLNRTPLLENNFLNANPVDGQFFLRYFQDCDARLCKFQNQIDHLLQRMEELEMLHSVKDSSGFASGPISSSNDPCLKEFPSAHIELADDECEAKSEEESQKKTISTSTMTSVTLEGNDRLVYREMIRVTDYSNCNKRDVSVQCVQNMNTNKIKNGPSRKKSSNCSDNCIPKYKNSVHNRSGGGENTKSHQKDKYLIERGSPAFQPIHAIENNENVAEDLNSSKSKNIQNPFPILESVEDDRLVANAEPFSGNENILPRLQSIMRNIDDLARPEDKVDFETPPMQVHTVPPQSHYKRTNSSRKKFTTCQNTSPKRIRHRYRSSSRSSTSSNVSVESRHSSPQHLDVRESDELYANNPHFSQASQKYLIKYGLISEKNSNMQKTFHRKSKSPERRHHLR